MNGMITTGWRLVFFRIFLENTRAWLFPRRRLTRANAELSSILPPDMFLTARLPELKRTSHGTEDERGPARKIQMEISKEGRSLLHDLTKCMVV